MQKLLYDYCFSDKPSGLLLIDMPTGTGKTHGAVKFIFENYKKVKNKIIFITNLKKNLPIKQLKQYFEDAGRLEDFDKDVLFLDNNVDMLIDKFEEIDSKIPSNKFTKDGALFNVRKSVKIINTLKNNLKDNKIDFDELGSKENAYFIINQAREDLRDKYEKQFREAIEEELRFDENGKKRTKAEKIKLIKDNPNYQWIAELYPAVNTDNKKIIFMSIDKFLVRNSTIVEPSYNIIDNQSIVKDSIIFIDEFDTSKDILLKNIISESLDTRVNIIELFRIIYSGIENTSFSRLLTEVSSDLKQKIDYNKRYYKPEEIIEEFRSTAISIEKKYNLVNYHKLEENEKERANFLFQDYKFHTILGDEKNFVYIDTDDKNKVNWIKKADNIKTTDNQNLFSLLQEIKSFLSYFQNGIKFIAENYRMLKKERNQETNNFSYEASIKTVLSEFGIEGKYLNYLTTQIMNSRKNSSYRIIDLKNELDCSVYEKGFRFYNFIDSDTFDTQSKINLLSFNMSPEKIMIYLCSNAKVVGISASGTLETVTGNYDLNYLKKKLGGLFYELNQEEEVRINSFIDKQLGDYRKINIEIVKCQITDKNYEVILTSKIGEDKTKKLLEEINKYSNDDFVRARYCKIAYAINTFFENGIKSYLFLTNISMNSNLNFNYTCINNIFEMLKPKDFDKKSYCYALEGSIEKFENLKQIIKDKLKKGQRVFVVSTYQTLGAGQNLQYEYDESFEGLLENINENTYEQKKKDFEAIFLDKPTNMFVNMNSNPTDDQLLKFIFQIKSLEENGHFTLEEAEKEIKKGIKILYHDSSQKIQTPRSKHIYMHTSKIILQAIGRICRTSTKNKKIYITYDSQMENDLANCKQELLNRRLNYEFKELLERCESVKQVSDEAVFNINNSKIKKNNEAIEKMLRFNSEADITKWEELREIVLKYPCDNDGIHDQYDIYCELKQLDDHYYFNKDEHNNYNITYDKVNDYCVSAELAQLQTLMSIKSIKKYFESKGYLTTFVKSKYILLPNVFTRIYLGALGEAVGEFIVNKYLNEMNLSLSRIKEKEKYEKFDFVFDENKYVDFKHWNGNNDKDRVSEIERVVKKLDKCNGKKAFIINILKPDNYDPKSYISSDERVVVIPYLYDPINHTWNEKDLKFLLG